MQLIDEMRCNQTKRAVAKKRHRLGMCSGLMREGMNRSLSQIMCDSVLVAYCVSKKSIAVVVGGPRQPTTLV